MQIIFTFTLYRNTSGWLLSQWQRLQKGGANVSDPFKIYFKKLSASE